MHYKVRQIFACSIWPVAAYTAGCMAVKTRKDNNCCTHTLPALSVAMPKHTRYTCISLPTNNITPHSCEMLIAYDTSKATENNSSPMQEPWPWAQQCTTNWRQILGPTSAEQHVCGAPCSVADRIPVHIHMHTCTCNRWHLRAGWLETHLCLRWLIQPAGWSKTAAPCCLPAAQADNVLCLVSTTVTP